MSVEPNDPTCSGPVLAAAIRPGIRLSRNEVETLCAKAARGAGMSWGHAEEAGRVAGWLVAQGVDGPAALLKQLTEADGTPWPLLTPVVETGHWRAAGQTPLCPIAVGAALADFSGLKEGLTEGRSLTVGPVGHPVLLLPFLCDIAGPAGRSVLLAWDGGRVTLGADGIESGDAGALFDTDAAVVILSMRERWAGIRPVPVRCTTAFACLGALDALAMRITVPPSAKSRSGAGSAAGDND